jgi:hypothetical protein
MTARSVRRRFEQRDLCAELPGDCREFFVGALQFESQQPSLFAAGDVGLGCQAVGRSGWLEELFESLKSRVLGFGIWHHGSLMSGRTANQGRMLNAGEASLCTVPHVGRET